MEAAIPVRIPKAKRALEAIVDERLVMIDQGVRNVYVGERRSD